jgi:DNA polymerase-3 subunit beta
MHITLDTINLKEVLEQVARVSTKHITLPVLQCVLIEAKKSSVYLKATNLEIGIEGKLAAEVSEEGVVAVSAQTLLQTINLISQKDVSLVVEGDVLHVETKTSKTEIKTVPTEEFPTIPKIDGEVFEIKGSLFAFGIKTTAFSASQSSIKPELGSVYIHQKKEHALTFVATDSFRLMEKTIPQKGVVLNNPILIPYKNALELARVIEGVDETISIHVTENQCAVVVGDIYVTARLVNGTFPDYNQIIPKEYKTNITTLTKDVAQALKKTNIFLNKFQQLTLTAADNTLILSSQNNDAGTTTESIKATIDGEDITLNFNQKYIHEVMGHFLDDSIILKCAGVGRPMVMENVHDKSIRYLVMPMNK